MLKEELNMKEETILKVLLIGILSEVRNSGTGLVSAYVAKGDVEILENILKKMEE